MKNKLKLVRDWIIIIISGMFDRRYYLEHYEDVKASPIFSRFPLVHFLKCGGAEGRNPSEKFNSEEYFQANPDVLGSGMNPLVHYLRCGKKEHRGFQPLDNFDGYYGGNAAWQKNIRVTGHPINAIPVVYTGEETKRINLVTDSLNSSSLLGGTATALVCASSLAKAYGYELRIITRSSEENPIYYWQCIQRSDIEAPDKVSFYSDYNRKRSDSNQYRMEMGTNEIFFATSWWSVKAIRATAPQCRILYIIQEVETFFYNYGTEHLLCSQVMQDPNIEFIVNSHYLNDYFKKEQPNIVQHGCWFEPAFSEKLYHVGCDEKKERLNLFFYARPNNPRNLFGYGLQMLDMAIQEGILDTNEWNICCVGQSAPEVTFCDGSKTINLGQLSWEEYAKFLSTVDLGLCLMYTPHPSYPPYDVACSGGVVLTNKMLNKQTFDDCANVIMADLSDEGMMEGFRQAVSLAKDRKTRQENYVSSKICRDWNEAMAPVIDYMKGKL